MVITSRQNVAIRVAREEIVAISVGGGGVNHVAVAIIEGDGYTGHTGLARILYAITVLIFPNDVTDGERRNLYKAVVACLVIRIVGIEVYVVGAGRDEIATIAQLGIGGIDFNHVAGGGAWLRNRQASKAVLTICIGAQRLQNRRAIGGVITIAVRIEIDQNISHWRVVCAAIVAVIGWVRAFTPHLIANATCGVDAHIVGGIVGAQADVRNLSNCRVICYSRVRISRVISPFVGGAHAPASGDVAELHTVVARQQVGELVEASGSRHRRHASRCRTSRIAE